MLQLSYNSNQSSMTRNHRSVEGEKLRLRSLKFFRNPVISVFATILRAFSIGVMLLIYAGCNRT
jgi:hypothetical protein